MPTPRFLTFLRLYVYGQFRKERTIRQKDPLGTTRSHGSIGTTPGEEVSGEKSLEVLPFQPVFGNILGVAASAGVSLRWQ